MPSSRPEPTGAANDPGAPGGTPAHQRAADAVRRRRLELGWTQEHLAERSGVSAATVRKIEGAAQPNYRDLTCTRLCAALGWTPDALDDLRTRPHQPRSGRPARVRRPEARLASDADGPSPSAAAPPAGAPRDAELAALNGRLAQLDDRQWERLKAFVDGLTATDG